MQGEEREFRPVAFPGVVVTLKSPTEREKRRLFRLGGDEMVEAALAAHVVKVAGHTCRGRTPTTPAEMKHCMKTLRMFFARTSPP